MKIRLSVFFDGMVWLTLPLFVAVFAWEHGLELSETGHILVQLLLLLPVFGWGYFWHLQSEYDRLRRRFQQPAAREPVRARLVSMDEQALEPLAAPMGLPRQPVVGLAPRLAVEKMDLNIVKNEQETARVYGSLN